MTFALPSQLPEYRIKGATRQTANGFTVPAYPSLTSDEADEWLEAFIVNATTILDAAMTVQQVKAHGGFDLREMQQLCNNLSETIYLANKVFNHGTPVCEAIKRAEPPQPKATYNQRSLKAQAQPTGAPKPTASNEETNNDQ